MGRSAMGEVVRSARLSDRWRIRQDDKLIFADALLFDDSLNSDLEKHFARKTVASGASCFATLIYVSNDCADSLTRVREVLSSHVIAGGASNLGPLIVARLLSSSNQHMRSVVAAIFNEIQGNSVQLPRVWNC